MRFAAERTGALAAHLGRQLSYPERIIISRIVALEWELRKQDAKMDAGEELSGHDMRARHAAENRLRLDLAALGLRAASAPVPTIAAILAAAAARRASTAPDAGNGVQHPAAAKPASEVQKAATAAAD